MSKHTHRGICQCCGRQQAVKNNSGKLADHGYTRKWGWQQGTCEGSGHPPVQLSTAHGDNVAIANRSYADELDRRTIADVKWVVVKERHPENPRKHIDVQYSVEELRASPKWANRAADVIALQLVKWQNEARQRREYASSIKRIQLHWFGKPLTPVQAEEEVERIREEGTLRALWERENQLREAGWKTRCVRDRWDRNFGTLTATRAKVAGGAA